MKNQLPTFVLVAIISLFVIAYDRAVSVSIIKKIAVVGAGPAGLGLAAAFKQMQSFRGEVVVFESRDDYTQANLGGGVQLTGGAVVLKDLNCLGMLNSTGERFRRVRSRNQDREALLFMDIDNIARETAPDLCDKDGNPLFFSIMRDALQSLLLNATQRTFAATDTTYQQQPTPTQDHEQLKVTIRPGQRCIQVSEMKGKNGQKTNLALEFAGGLVEDGFDLVVGADGINSVIRSYVSNDRFFKLPELKPFYSGIRIAYALTDVDADFSLRVSPSNAPSQAEGGGRGDAEGGSNGREEFHQWFGDGCYALVASYGGLRGPQHMLAVIYRDAMDAALGENPSWRSSTNKEALRARLTAAGFAGNAELMQLLDACQEDRFVDVGVQNRLLPLPHWASRSGRVILMGDSAHAM